MASDKIEGKGDSKLDVKADAKEKDKETTKAEPKLAVAAPPAPAPRDSARDKAIELAVSTIEKQFGKGSIMRLGEDVPPPEVKVVATGSLALDIALGCGGL